MKEFKVNEYITLKLEGGATYIYVNGQKFLQCFSLLLNIPQDKIMEYEKIESIDEAADILGWTEDGQERIDEFSITPETEFWGHCSNLQTWVENNFDTRILHSNLAFPLLKRLTDMGDPQAKRIFKEEIAKRLESGYSSVVKYLINERYLDYLDKNSLTPKFIADLFINYLNVDFSDDFYWENIQSYKDFIKKFDVQQSHEFIEELILKIKNVENVIGRKIIYFYLIRPLPNEILKACINNLIQANEPSILFNFLIDYLKKDITPIPRLRGIIPSNPNFKGKILQILKNSNLNEIFIISILDLIRTSLDRNEIKEILADQKLKFFENYVLAYELNKLDEDHEIYSEKFEEMENRFEEYYFDDHDEKDGIFRLNFGFIKYDIKENREKFCSFLGDNFPYLFEKQLTQLLKQGNDKVLTALIDNCFLDFLSIKRIVSILEHNPEKLEKLYSIFKELLYEVDFETFLRENFYEYQGSFFMELGDHLTPVLRTKLREILEKGDKSDEIYFENLEWLDKLKDKVKYSLDPSKYKKMDEWFKKEK